MLLEQILAAGFLDWLALLTSLAYVVLAARDNDWCWLFAAVSTAVWAYQSFFEYQLISDGFLQVFYFVMAGVGIWRWRQLRQSGQNSTGNEVPDAPLPARTSTAPAAAPGILRMTLCEHALTLAGGLLGGGLLYYFVSSSFVAAATLPDALTTAFSVIVTFLLIGRRLENWLYWIVIDVAYVWIYAGQGAILFAAMMVINVGVAAYGFYHWRRALHPRAA